MAYELSIPGPSDAVGQRHFALAQLQNIAASAQRSSSAHEDIANVTRDAALAQARAQAEATEISQAQLAVSRHQLATAEDQLNQAVIASGLLLKLYETGDRLYALTTSMADAQAKQTDIATQVLNTQKQQSSAVEFVHSCRKTLRQLQSFKDEVAVVYWARWQAKAITDSGVVTAHIPSLSDKETYDDIVTEVGRLGRPSERNVELLLGDYYQKLDEVRAALRQIAGHSLAPKLPPVASQSDWDALRPKQPVIGGHPVVIEHVEYIVRARSVLNNRMEAGLFAAMVAFMFTAGPILIWAPTRISAALLVGVVFAAMGVLVSNAILENIARARVSKHPEAQSLANVLEYGLSGVLIGQKLAFERELRRLSDECREYTSKLDVWKKERQASRKQESAWIEAENQRRRQANQRRDDEVKRRKDQLREKMMIVCDFHKVHPEMGPPPRECVPG